MPPKLCPNGQPADKRERREAAGYQQHGERKKAGLFAIGADALGEHQLEAPEHGSKQQENTGEAEGVEHDVGEDGAGRAQRVGGRCRRQRA